MKEIKAYIKKHKLAVAMSWWTRWFRLLKKRHIQALKAMGKFMWATSSRRYASVPVNAAMTPFKERKNSCTESVIFSYSFLDLPHLHT